MRISTSQMANSGLSNMLDQSAKLSKLQEHLATGKNFLTPSEDPQGAARLLTLNQTLEVTTQYQKNGNVAKARLGIEGNVLSSLNNVMDRVRELAIQGNSATNSETERNAIADEIRQRLSELLSLANSKDGNGEYLFSGNKGNVPSFAADGSGGFIYNGDDGQRFVQIGNSRQVAVGDSGTEVFRAIRTGNGTFATQENSSNNGSGVIDSGVVTNLSSYDGDTYQVYFPLVTTATGTMSFNDFVGTNDNLTYSLDINGTTVYSVNEGGVPVNNLDDLAGVINDDSSTTGVRAVVTGGQLYLSNTSPSGSAIVVQESLSGASDGGADQITGYFGGNLSGLTLSSTQTLSADDASIYVVEDSLGNVEASGNYSSGSQISFNGIGINISGSPTTGDSFQVSPSVNKNLFSTVQDIAIALENTSAGEASVAHLGNSVNRFLTDIDQAMENIRSLNATVGARMNALEAQNNINEDLKLQVNASISNIEDLDYIKAASQMQLQLIGLQAAQQSFSKIQNLSLFNFLR